MTAARAFSSSAARLLVAAALLAAGLMAGIPAAKDFVARTSVTGGADALLEALHTARMEALARNAQVTICKSPSAHDELPRCADSAAAWPEGWVVFVDGGTIGSIEPADHVISRGRSAVKLDAVTERPAPLASITFHPVGPVTGPTSPFEIHLAASLTHGSFERVICLSLLGRAHLAKSGSCQA